MSSLERRSGPRPAELVRRAPRARLLPATRPAGRPTADGVADAAPRILVAGVLRRVEWLRALGRTRRAQWRLLAPRAARSGADLVVVGRPSAGADAVAVIAGLKDDPATAAIPVLHAGPAEAGCAGCRADVCLSTGSTPGQLARVAGALLELARARARRSGLSAARASHAAGEASRPAP